MSLAALAASASGAHEAAELDAFLAAAGGGSSSGGRGASSSSQLQQQQQQQQHDASLKAYFRELKKVISLSDVLLQVLDARDPLGSRSLSTERLIRSQGKRIVLVLNKVDLVPQENVLAWLRYLRHDFPTLAFKSSTQSQRSNLAQKHVGGGSSAAGAQTSLAPHQQTQAALGAQALLSLLKNYSRSLNLKTSLTVGIFGAPNVGKSSLINSLKRARVCSVASTPGHTKVMQGVMLDKHVRLLDCPGIVFSDAGEGREHASVVQLRNVIKVESVPDPTGPVEAILRRVSPATLRKLYNLDVRSLSVASTGMADDAQLDPNQPLPDPDAQDFLLRLALQRGRLGRGGIPDTDATARSMLHDWNTGKIPFFTQPPKFHPSAILSKDRRKAGAGVADDAQMDLSGGATSMEAVAAAAAAASAAAAQGQDHSASNGAPAPSTAEPSIEDSAAIVSSFSEAFDLAGLLGEADAELLGGGGSGGGTGTGMGTTSTIPEPGSAAKTAKAKAKAAVPGEDPSAGASAGSGKSALGKRRRGAGGGRQDPPSLLELEDDERADEPAWKARQRHRAQSARHGASGGMSDAAHAVSRLAGGDVVMGVAASVGGGGGGGGGENALSRAALKKAKKKAKRREEVERKEGLAGPGGLLDQMELAFSIGMEEEKDSLDDDDDVEDKHGGQEGTGGAKGHPAAAARVDEKMELSLPPPATGPGGAASVQAQQEQVAQAGKPAPPAVANQRKDEDEDEEW